MVEFKAELEMERFQLAEADRVTRDEKSPPMELEGWVELAKPAVTPLTDQLVANDPELAAFWNAERGRHRYDYVALACSFGPSERQPFQKAWIEVTLAAESADHEVIAWSMNPLAVVESQKSTDSAKLGANFEILSAEISRAEETVSSEWFLRAFRERTSKPYWEIRRTKQSPIVGSHRLHMVVRRPAGSAGEGTVTLSAVVEQRKFFIFPGSKPLDQPSSISFTMPN